MALLTRDMRLTGGGAGERAGKTDLSQRGRAAREGGRVQGFCQGTAAAHRQHCTVRPHLSLSIPRQKYLQRNRVHYFLHPVAVYPLPWLPAAFLLRPPEY